MKKSVKAITISAIAFLCLFSSIAFGYFILSKGLGSDTDFKVKVNKEGNTLISSEYDLRTVAHYSYFESLTNVSDVTERKILIFTKDIILTKSLIIETDVNMLFKEFKIDLNGWDLTIRHTFYGSLLLDGTSMGENGGIINSKESGTFNLEIPNMTVIENNFTCKSMVNDNSTLLNIANFDFEKVSQEIFEFIQKSFNKYYIDDMPFIFSYKNYPIEFNYVSSNTQAVSNRGNVTRHNTDDQEVGITINLKFYRMAEDEPLVAIKNYNATILSLDCDMSVIGMDFIDEYFQRYIVGKNEGIDQFNITSDLLLITKYEHLSLKYTYELKSTGAWNFDAITGNILTMWESGMRVLKVNLYDDASDKLISSKEYQFYSISISNFDTVNLILRQMRVLKVDNLKSGIYLHSGENVVLKPDGTWPLPTKESLLKYPNISSVKYELLDDANTFYEVLIVNGESLLTVKKLPTRYDALYIKYSFNFSFGLPLSIERNVKVHYSDINEDGGGEGDDAFDFVYDAINQELFAQSNMTGETFKSFYLPSEYGGVAIGYSINNPIEEWQAFILNKDDNVENGRFIIDTNLIPAYDVDLTISLYFRGATTPYARNLKVKIVGIIKNIVDNVGDKNLYDYLLNIFDVKDKDGNGDNILTVTEATQTKDIVIGLNDNVSTNISSFKGLEYFKNVPSFSLYNTAVGDLATYLNTENMTKLQINKCTFGGAVALGNMPLVKELDLSDNEITQINNILQFYPKLEMLKLHNNNFTTLTGLERQTSVKTLTIDMPNGAEINNQPLLRSLIELKKLKSVYLYNVTVTNADLVLLPNGNTGVKYASVFGKNNYSVYALLMSKNVEFFVVTETKNYALTLPDENTIKGGRVLESIFYTLVGSQLMLPNKMYYDETNFYTINWEFPTGTVTEVSGDKIIVNGVIAEIRVVAKVTINGVETQKMFVINEVVVA